MSQASTPPPAPPVPRPPPPARNGCLTALLIGVGILLLLPGVCAALIIGMDPRGLTNRNTLTTCLSFFAVAASGVVLIWFAVRRPR